LLFKERKRHEEAEAEFRKEIAAAPDEPLYPDNLGDLFREGKRYREAEEC
jgi:hypothetical protein